MLSTIHKRRLLKLARFLEALPVHKFDLCVVAVADNEADLPTKDNFPNCGTVACAMGWCPFVFPTLVEYVEMGCVRWGKEYFHVKFGQGGTDYDGAEYFFGLRPERVGPWWEVTNANDAHYLFDPGRYPRNKRTAKDVVNRIRGFVEANGEIDQKSRAYNLKY